MSGVNLSNIAHNFQLMLKRLQFLYNEKQKLEQLVLEEQTENSKLQAHIKALEEKIKILKMTNPSENGTVPENEMKKEMRTTLNAYIHEIDNCIALLNK